MKHLNKIYFAAFGLMTLGLFNACSNKCNGIVCVTGPPVALLDIRDAH